MKKNKVFFFILSSLILTLVICGISFVREITREESLMRESEALMDSFQNRFEDAVNTFTQKGIISAEYLSQGIMSQKNYEELGSELIRNHKEILGLNLLDQEGKIIKVFPFEENQKSLGRVTQNIEALRISVRNDEEYWFSPPFTLYQGPSGFAIYFPIRKDHTLVGWIAPVASLEDFFKKLIKDVYLKDYHLIILDTKTGRPYFKTADGPRPSHKFIEQIENVRGRDMTFISWPKNPITRFGHWIWNLALGLTLAFILTYFYSLSELRGRNNLQIEDIEHLLRFSLQDAASSAALIQNQAELTKRGASHVPIDRITLYAGHITNLLDQIKFLRRMTNLEESTKLTEVPVFQSLIQMMDYYQDKIQFRGVQFLLHEEDFNQVSVMANKWLLTHTVFGNLLSHAIQNAPDQSSIEIKCTRVDSHYQITIKNISTEGPLVPERKTIERGLGSARRVLELFHGDLLLENDLRGQLIYIIILPTLH